MTIPCHIVNEGENNEGKRAIEGRNKEDLHEEQMQAWDDITGEELDPAKVLRARLKELEYIREKGVWRKIKRSDAKARGIKIIGVRWIDHNKVDEDQPELRSRLVVQE